jgi:hypothetical protein
VVAALARQLFEVCLLRRGPQDLPYSVAAAQSALAALLALQAAAGIFTAVPFGAVAGRLAVTLLLLAGITPWLLASRGFGNRIAQTLLAQAGTGLLFSLAMLPVALALLGYVGAPEARAEPPPQALLPAFAALVLFLWKLRVDAAIWGHALELRRPVALLLALGLVVAELVLLMLLSPSVPAPPAS